MSNQERYFTTKEAAAELNVSIPTIYKYVKDKKLQPVYEDKWQIDATLLFYPEDIEHLKEKRLNKPGLTTGEVAKLLSVHASTVLSYLKQGILHGSKHLYNGRFIYFIQEEEVQRFKEEHNFYKTQENKSFYFKPKKLYLYQTLVNKNSLETARIMELNGDSGKVLTENGEIFSLDTLEEKGFQKKEEFEVKNHITKPGYATFQFNKPAHIGSPVFHLLEVFYRKLGYKNIHLTEREGIIYLGVKPCLIPLWEDTHHHEINFLQESITEGTLSVRHNGVLIDSGLEPLVVHVKSDIKEKIKEIAKKEQLSVNDYIANLLETEILKEKGNI